MGTLNSPTAPDMPGDESVLSLSVTRSRDPARVGTLRRAEWRWVCVSLGAMVDHQATRHRTQPGFCHSGFLCLLLGSLASGSRLTLPLHRPNLLPELPPSGSSAADQLVLVAFSSSQAWSVFRPGHLLGPLAQCPQEPHSSRPHLLSFPPSWGKAFVMGPFPPRGVLQWPLRVPPPPRVLTGGTVNPLPANPGVGFHGLGLSLSS